MLDVLQRKDEINLSVNCNESIKKHQDSAWLNPKHCKNEQSATKPRIEESSTTILFIGVAKAKR